MPGDNFKTIYFVEDNEVVLTAYQKVLEQAGYCVQTAKDGLEAMRLLHHAVPDLVLLDLLLPRFDGLAVLKFIRGDSRLSAVPVIIFSTNSIIDAQDEPLLANATKRLLKCQCNPSIMLQTLHEVFESQAVKSESANAHEEQHGQSPLTLELVAVMPQA